MTQRAVRTGLTAAAGRASSRLQAAAAACSNFTQEVFS